MMWGDCGAAGSGCGLRQREGTNSLESMARTKTDSRSQTARSRARQAMSEELERARKRESKLVAVFSAIDARQEAEASLGGALIELRDLGVPQSDLAEMIGLSARDVGAAIRSAKDFEDETDGAADDKSERAGSESDDAESGAAVDNSDSNGASEH